MIKKNLILLTAIIAVLLLLIAVFFYPGGSQFDQSAVGFDWVNNYLSDLFAPIAVNGSTNNARFWAVGGMFFLCISLGAFFLSISRKIQAKRSSNIIKYCGVGAVVTAFLTVSPLHDIMIPLASTLALISCFYITIFVLKSKLHLLKTLSITLILLFYTCLYVYFTRNFVELLPILQKGFFVTMIIWVISLEYFTERDHFKV